MMEDLLFALLRSGIALTLSAIAVLLVMHVCKVKSPTTRRIACFAVVLSGCCFTQWTIDIPLLPANTAVTSIDIEFQQAANENPTNDSFVAQLPLNLVATPIAVPEVVPVTATANASAAHQGMDWKGYILLAWTIGIVGIVARSIWNYVQFVRNMPAEQTIDEQWKAEWKALQKAAEIQRTIPLYMTEQAGPMICWFPSGYRLLVPKLLWSQLTQIQRASILQHELAHVKRHDVWKSLAIRILALPHWFNPLVWRVVKQFDDCAEWACDEAARRNSPSHVPEFARALLQLGNDFENTLLMNLGAQGHGLAHRIRRLLVNSHQKDSMMKKLTIAMFVLGISTFSLLNFQLVAEEVTVETVIETPTQTQPDKFTKQIVVEQSADPLPQPETVETQVTDLVVSEPYSVADVKTETQTDPTKADTLTVDVNTSAFRQASPSDSVKNEAEIDLGYLFSNLKEFQTARKNYISRVAEQKKAAIKRVAELEALYGQLENLSKETDFRGQAGALAKAVQERRAEIIKETAATKQKFRELEAKLYSRTYDKVLAEIRAYAKERNFDIVRRKIQRKPLTRGGISVDVSKKLKASTNEDSEPNGDFVFDKNGKPVAVKTMIVGKTETRYLVASNSAKDSKSILTRMNQDILYAKHNRLITEDITQEILKRLNERYAEENASANEKELPTY